MRAGRFFAAAAVLALVPASPVLALAFNFTTISGDSLTSDQAAAFAAAGQAWASVLNDPITVNVQIGFATLGSGILGSTSASFGEYTYAAVAAALGRDARSSDDALAVGSFASAYKGNYALTTAQARAIGLTTNAAPDASIEFSSGFTFSTSRNADGSVAAGTYDLIGVAEHEIGHALGFVSSADGGFGSDQTLLDQFRYSAPGTRNVQNVSGVYFSLDNGATSIAGFSPGSNDNYQASHWLQGTTSDEVTGTMRHDVNALMDPAAAPGQAINITALDLRALDVIGYNRTNAVAPLPEPSTWAMLVLGFGAIGIARRRDRMLARVN